MTRVTVLRAGRPPHARGGVPAKLDEQERLLKSSPRPGGVPLTFAAITGGATVGPTPVGAFRGSAPWPPGPITARGPGREHPPRVYAGQAACGHAFLNRVPPVRILPGRPSIRSGPGAQLPR